MLVSSCRVLIRVSSFICRVLYIIISHIAVVCLVILFLVTVCVLDVVLPVQFFGSFCCISISTRSYPILYVSTVKNNVNLCPFVCNSVQSFYCFCLFWKQVKNIQFSLCGATLHNSSSPRFLKSYLCCVCSPGCLINSCINRLRIIIILVYGQFLCGFVAVRSEMPLNLYLNIFR